MKENEAGLYALVETCNRVLFRDGEPIYPTQIEDLLCALDGIAAAGVVVRGNILTACIQEQTGSARESLTKDIKSLVPVLDEVGWLDSIPLNASFQVDREALAERWLAMRPDGDSG